MKYILQALLALVIGSLSVSCSSTSPDLTKQQVRKAGGPLYRVKTTAYTHTESDHKSFGRGSATGNSLLYGNVRSAAADWSLFPMGTVFRIKGESPVYVVDDYGRALVGTKTIDLYRPSGGQMDSWGSRNVNIEIVQWGSYKQSLNVLSDRKQHPHVQAMISSILRKGGGRSS
jgi:3D (Asp-Asp-Asp) domain-containing protein